MNPNDYIRLAMRTECDNEKPRERLYGLLTTDTPVLFPTRLLHAILGMQDEIGEIAKTFKGWIYYGKPLDTLNVVEELGDLQWFIALACDALGVDMEHALMEANIRKLQVRFPDKFTEALALEASRKREEERQAILKQIRDAGDRRDWEKCDQLDLRLMRLREQDEPTPTMEELKVLREAYEKSPPLENQEFERQGRIVNKVLEHAMLTEHNLIPPFRTKSQVLQARSTVIGCCDRHADNQACNCLIQAEIDEKRFAYNPTTPGVE